MRAGWRQALPVALPLLLELELQAARPAAASPAAASPAAIRRPRPDARSDLRVLRMVMIFIPSAVRVVAAAVRPGSPGYRPPEEVPGRHRHPERSPGSATTRLRMVPTPSMVISITSPG